MRWQEIINIEIKKDYFIKLETFLDNEYLNSNIFPPKNLLFNAFSLCEYKELKVVILGQDPYHSLNQAQGLAFSTPKNIKNPPSLVNILKEVKSDMGITTCANGDLSPWAKQGVLLINVVFSVEEAKPNSHKNKGWEIFTDNIIKHINDNFNDIVFILWGGYAIKKSKLIDINKHHIISSVHPSPLSSYRGFFGSRPFSKTNNILKSLNKKVIIW